ncbi:MAG TPA: Uma2 family endonuclease, partial [Gemmatimonadaceae bacterium]|nr:Uma2 family endonuclease [Gemmatimonadaceae bacterium]
MPELRSHPKRWTAYEVRALMEASPAHWPRYETIDGELIVTPAPRLAHQLVLELLRDVLKPYIKSQELGLVLGAPADLELEPDTIVQPDLFVVPAALGHPRNWEDVTALLLAIEVLSPGSRRHDRTTKRRFFQRVAVPEYWTVDLAAQVVERWRQGSKRPETATVTLLWQPNV